MFWVDQDSSALLSGYCSFRVAAENIMLKSELFLAEFEARGSVLVENALSEELVREYRAALEKAIDAEVRYHGTTDFPDYGMVQCCAMYDRLFINLLDDQHLMEPFRFVLGDGCIVYAYTASSIPPRGTNFAARIHVDCPRLIPGYISNMGLIIALDDFVEENGATWFLPGSQTRSQAPSDEGFFSEGERLVAKAGSAWYFNTRLWHAAGANDTQRWRHAVTINMCRPFMKQRYDIPRLLSQIDLQGVSDSALQKLGFFAQPPASLDEYYAPPEKRTFRQPYE
jgi:ectoine hydroxylase-related dioxygenase (phytanoyl-CoA dioxygenase family)